MQLREGWITKEGRLSSLVRENKARIWNLILLEKKSQARQASKALHAMGKPVWLVGGGEM
jgi:hypothetical protein